jgi:GntR family transcriptional regulator
MARSSLNTEAPDPRLPRYLQIRDALMRRICARAWTEGEALPAEDKLAAQYAASVGTLRKALEVLVSEGIVERIHGRGTFVTRAFDRISMLRFVGFSLKDTNELPETATLAIQIVQEPAEARQKLGLQASEKMLYLHRTRSIGQEVLLSEHVWLPYKRFAKLEAYLRKNNPLLLYPVYDALCGVLVSRAADQLSITALPNAEAALFKRTKKTLGVRIERCMTEHTGQVIEWRVAYITTDRFQYTVETR